jgi:hypothetical protein
MALPTRMTLQPGLLRLTRMWPRLFSVHHEILFFNLTYPVTCFRVPPKNVLG